MCDVYKTVQELEKKAQSSLVRLSWHNLLRVRQIYKSTLGIVFSENLVSELIKEIRKRHDIVHRNGKTLDGQWVNVDVAQVMKNVEALVRDIET